MTKLFPTILIALMFLSGCVCLYKKDWKMATYWFAAAVLNVSITYL